MNILNTFGRVIALVILTAICYSLPAQQGRISKNPGVRLKYFTDPKQVFLAIGDANPSYTLDEHSNFKNIGKYPAIPHIFYYSIGLSKDFGNDRKSFVSIKSEAGKGKEKLADLLADDPEVEQVSDPRLGTGQYSNVVAVRFKSERSTDWHYTLIIRLREINNQDNQTINLTGMFSHWDDAAAPEPWSANQAITVMLKLVEPIP